jgi:hypothetical protein
VKVESTRRRIEARCSQAPLKSDIAQRCRLLNEKKTVLDIKADTSASAKKHEFPEKELNDLEEKVRATRQLIQGEKDSIANSK